ncbi:MAG: AsmA family protein [Bacteroidales bacterium]|jgi:uncharacterized protein involved in outer membrane biogenesis|nr:AsmA family protein [Bacteroidales bacterium]
MKRLRKYLLWTLGSLFALFITVSAVVYFAVLRDEDKIKNIVIGELNKSLTGEVSVERMNFTFWSSFPYIALDFRNVKSMGSNPKDLEPLLEAKSLSLNFNLRDMFAKKYEVKKIELSGATVRIKLYADDTENYNLWKSSDTTSSDFSFALKKIQFKNTQLIFVNERSEQRYELYFYRADAKGDFSKNLHEISLFGDFHLDMLQSKETIILAEKNMSLRTQVRVDNSEQTIHFIDGFIRLEDLNFDLSGFVNYSDNAPNMNLEVVGKNLNLQKFAKQLPAKFAQEIESYRTKGDFDFRLVISGNYQGDNLPKIASEWTFRNGEIYEKNTKTQLKNVQFSGVFSTSNQNQLSNCRLQIRDFSAQTESGHLVANFSISNFQSPTIRLNTAFGTSLEELVTLISVPEIVKISGQSIGRIQYRHTFKSFDAIDISEILNGQFQGEISCKNVFCKLQDSIVKSPIRLDTAHFKFNQNHLQASIAKGEFEGSKFETSLFAHDFFKYLKTLELMYAHGDLNVDSNPEQSKESDNRSFDPLKMASHISLSFHYQNRILFVDKLFANVFDGSVSGVAEVNFSDKARLPFRFEGELSKINAEKLFADMDNFGQTEITDKNLKGFIDADLSAIGTYLPQSGLDMKSLWITMRTKISNGELNNVAMFQKLSRFVDEETLNHVKFATLENTIEIKNEVITIPEMKIVSNALNINLSGVHQFDGKIDYNVKVALSELLSKRRRERQKNQEELGVVEDEKKRISLFVYVTGTTDNPKFRYDFKNVFNKLELGSGTASAAIKKEREVVKNVFKEEFHFLQKSEETKRQEALWREQEKGKFVIEWEEEKPEEEVSKTPARNRRPPAKKDTTRIRVVFEDD